jgi:hypothetical protein
MLRKLRGGSDDLLMGRLDAIAVPGNQEKSIDQNSGFPAHSTAVCQMVDSSGFLFLWLISP